MKRANNHSYLFILLFFIFNIVICKGYISEFDNIKNDLQTYSWIYDNDNGEFLIPDAVEHSSILFKKIMIKALLDSLNISDNARYDDGAKEIFNPPFISKNIFNEKIRKKDQKIIDPPSFDLIKDK